jgi:hypothetical protein
MEMGWIKAAVQQKIERKLAHMDLENTRLGPFRRLLDRAEFDT